jgi:DNA-binding MarR family transcriptional regulator
MTDEQPQDGGGRSVPGSTAPSGMAIEELHRGLMPLIMQTYFYTRRSFDNAMRAHGVTASQAGVLSRIYEHPGISGAEISRQMFTTPQSVQLILATLERKGLLVREPDPTQGRVIGSRITDEGCRIFIACHHDAAEVDRRLSESLSPEERRTLIDLLERYLDRSKRSVASKPVDNNDRRKK